MFQNRVCYFFYCLLCFVSVSALAQEVPSPSCSVVQYQSCASPGSLQYAADQCYLSFPNGYFGLSNHTCALQGDVAFVCSTSCTCPSGYQFAGNQCVEIPQCEAGPAGVHQFSPDGYLSCVGSCEVVQVSDSSCTGTAAEGGVCTASFDFTGNACPGEGDGDGGGSASSASSDSGGGGSSGGQASSSGGGDGGDNGGGDSSSGSGSSGGSASSSGNGNGGTCPEGQISQGTLNGNAICVGQCPTGQYWGAVNGVYGCYGGNGSSSGSGSSDGTGECDPKSKDYAKCIGQINDVDDGLSDQIVGDATGEAEDRLNDAYDSLMEDVEDFSGIDSEFSGAPNQLMSALQGFLPAPVGCSNVPLTFLGHTASLDCNLFNDFKLAFGWFLSILTAVYIWSLATKPVQR